MERTGGIIDVQGGFPHGTPFEKTIHAWPHLRSIPAPADADGDGMPDDWEIKKGLDPKDPADGRSSKGSNMFTNIELYINELTK